ncbi:hypothetical protein GMDG_05641 [Pseudogymnoascus destructans 20631-21]|uniref:Uncharacterized protein n=1 Tax=Pseudogymnoascus destructans (strain ATCC MYA-4855 / 20631-21) TaxID=658429 RepID=L8FP78_PSED2|nr:hypothetical protein GMDG_05641 [Pseudogymnoascus destructans 20631-21]
MTSNAPIDGPSATSPSNPPTTTSPPPTGNIHHLKQPRQPLLHHSLPPANTHPPRPLNHHPLNPHLPRNPNLQRPFRHAHPLPSPLPPLRRQRPLLRHHALDLRLRNRHGALLLRLRATRAAVHAADLHGHTGQVWGVGSGDCASTGRGGGGRGEYPGCAGDEA